MKHFILCFFSRLKGALGEWLFCRHLSRHLPHVDYRILRNVYLPFKDGGTTQIDCIVVSRFGVFVIEVKSMRGCIFGSEHGRKWTQTFFRRHETFGNPLLQNYAHTQTIVDLVDVPSSAVHSIVAFHGAAEFKTPMPDNVLHFADVPGYVLSFDSPSLTDGKAEFVRLLVEGWRDSVSFFSKVTHVRNLRERHGRKLNG